MRYILQEDHWVERYETQICTFFHRQLDNTRYCEDGRVGVIGDMKNFGRFACGIIVE